MVQCLLACLLRSRPRFDSYNIQMSLSHLGFKGVGKLMEQDTIKFVCSATSIKECWVRMGQINVDLRLMFELFIAAWWTIWQQKLLSWIQKSWFCGFLIVLAKLRNFTIGEIGRRDPNLHFINKNLRQVDSGKNKKWGPVATFVRHFAKTWRFHEWKTFNHGV